MSAKTPSVWPTKFVAFILGVVFSTISIQAALSAEVVVQIAGVRNDKGEILGAICQREEFLKARCQYRAQQTARSGTVKLNFSDVLPGSYAIQIFHDENSDGKLNRNSRGIPTEGYAFSNNATSRLGPPPFFDAEVDIGAMQNAFAIEMKY